MSGPQRDLHPLLVWELERLQAAGEKHRRIRGEDQARRREWRERNPDSPNLVAQPDPPDPPATDEELLEAFFAYALQEIELDLRDDLAGVRAQLDAIRHHWLEAHDDPDEAGIWLRFRSDEALDVFASAIVRRELEHRTGE